MRMYDIITKKKHGLPLTEDEIRFFVEGFTAGEIPDYQASALLMAICLKGMDGQETAVLTDAMARSGDMADLSPIPGVKVDKHSTGGVGDKTSLIIGPIVAACGVPVAKMSGRGLGHTGGTVDKLESIPGLETAIATERFFQIVRDTGLAIIGQSGNIAPADKKLYALRDVTATVDCIPLIAASIMSKKLAAGSDAILLDVKTGSGAFMKTQGSAVELAETMVSIGSHAGRRVMALVTDMDAPLGNAVGNALELIEVVDTLRGNGPADLTAVCLELASYMLLLAGLGDLPHCRSLARHAVDSGGALERLTAMVTAQGGDAAVIKDTSLFPAAKTISPFRAVRGGYVTRMDAETIGIASAALGAGRVRKEDAIDHSAGIILQKKPGDRVSDGEPLAVLYTSDRNRQKEAETILSASITIGDVPPPSKKTIIAAVTDSGITML